MWQSRGRLSSSSNRTIYTPIVTGDKYLSRQGYPEVNQSRLKHKLLMLYRRLPLPPRLKTGLLKLYSRRSRSLRKLAGQPQSGLNVLTIDPLQAMLRKSEQYDVECPWVLIVDERIPTPDQDSGSVRMFAIIRLLKSIGYKVMFVVDKSIDLPGYDAVLRQHGIEVLHDFQNAAKHLEDVGGRYHFVVLSRPNTAHRYLPIVRANAIHAQVIYDTVDLHWVRLERAAALSPDFGEGEEAEYYKRLELFNVACCDLTLAITTEEKAQILSEQPLSHIEILPNIHELKPGEKSFADRHGLMFIGGFWHKPNEDAILYFVDKILPIIIDELPDVVLHVIGSNMPNSIKSVKSRHINPVGFVPDVSGYFGSARVFVSPLRYGAGLKGKIGQSMAFGLPVVTTSIGAEGFNLDNGNTGFIADTPEEFSAAVVQLYNNELLWEKIASNALQEIEANYSMHSARQRMEKLFSRHPLSQPGDAGTAHV